MCHLTSCKGVFESFVDSALIGFSVFPLDLGFVFWVFSMFPSSLSTQ